MKNFLPNGQRRRQKLYRLEVATNTIAGFVLLMRYLYQEPL
ncbi:Unknown protein sequence [Pseudomonas syringae pv. maculicola]|nr:Unknown protein sequence [Pseudomonas syringae pv. maculicola]